MLTQHDRTILRWSRIYRTIYNRITKDCFGADWRTLRIGNPQAYVALRLAYDAMRQDERGRIRTNGIEVNTNQRS